PVRPRAELRLPQPGGARRGRRRAPRGGHRRVRALGAHRGPRRSPPPPHLRVVRTRRGRPRVGRARAIGRGGRGGHHAHDRLPHPAPPTRPGRRLRELRLTQPAELLSLDDANGIGSPFFNAAMSALTWSGAISPVPRAATLPLASTSTK